MNLIFKIALRNILLHKGKSLIIGAIIFMGSLIMTVGNATVAGMDQGIRRSIVDGLFGDIVILSKREKNDASLMAAMGETAEVISGYTNIKAALETHPDVAAFIPFTKGLMMVLLDIETPVGQPPFLFTFGVDFERYVKMFDNIELISGRLPRPGERGVVIHRKHRDWFYELYGTLYNPVDDPWNTNQLSLLAVSNLSKLSPETNMIIMGISDKNSTLDIRIPVLGIYRNKKIDAMDIDLMDLESYREAMNYSTAGDEGLKLSSSETSLLKLDEANPDAMFSGGGLIQMGSAAAPDVQSLFTARDRKPKMVDVDLGTYEVISVRVKDSKTSLAAVDRLNKMFQEKNLDARAVHWIKAAGTLASMVNIIKGVLFAFTFFIFFVAIIIIMNTLAMATLERMSELGMMRAVGAQKGFLALMLLGETFVLSGFFGGLGMLSGAGLTWFLAALKKTSNNDMVQLFFGGNVYHPMITAPDVVLGLAELALVTVLAVLYPAYLARKVKPLDAITRD
ncbi:MAG: FtsX-like permease family protein [Spirochaetia bacterium]|nr:FtsX-like permease family protein [Spirochaetia bacterium]